VHEVFGRRDDLRALEGVGALLEQAVAHVRDVLRPLEVRDGHAARVQIDVGQDQDALLQEDLLGLGGRRSVGRFGDDARLHLVGVLPRDLILEGPRG
jgi:hypothetical protein